MISFFFSFHFRTEDSDLRTYIGRNKIILNSLYQSNPGTSEESRTLKTKSLKIFQSSLLKKKKKPAKLNSLSRTVSINEKGVESERLRSFKRENNNRAFIE